MTDVVEEKVTLMCNSCSYVYRAPIGPNYYPGAPDAVCSEPVPGQLVPPPFLPGMVPPPGTYADLTKDPGIRCDPTSLGL